MPSRRLICLAVLALAPLSAQVRAEARAETPPAASSDIARQLADPANQVAATVALTAPSEALLDIRVEPLRRAMDAMGGDMARDLPRDARLRDLAGPGARALPGEIGRRVPQTMGAAAGMAGAIEAMLPELRAAAERMKDAIPPG